MSRSPSRRTADVHDHQFHPILCDTIHFPFTCLPKLNCSVCLFVWLVSFFFFFSFRIFVSCFNIFQSRDIRFQINQYENSHFFLFGIWNVFFFFFDLCFVVLCLNCQNRPKTKIACVNTNKKCFKKIVDLGKLESFSSIHRLWCNVCSGLFLSLPPSLARSIALSLSPTL